jgi:hypothetical protein
VPAALKNDFHLLKLECQACHSGLKNGDVVDQCDNTLLGRAGHAVIGNDKYSTNDGRQRGRPNGPKI